jgi:carbon monoxide dehydrogenase subunit G
VRIGSSFEVPAADDEVWALLRDVPRVVSCMPGAELIETIDDSTWKTKMSVKLGPMTLGFTADVKREDADEAARRVRLSAKARELRGRGGAGATVESTLTELGSGTRVSVVTNLTLSGAVPQYGDPVVKDVSAQLVSRFADCLREQLESVSPEGRDAATTATPRPVSGLSLLLRAIGRTIGGAIRRLAKRGPGA